MLLFMETAVKPYFCLCGAMHSASTWTSLMHWVACLRPACVIVGRHIGLGAAQWLPREPSNIPRKIPEMVIKWNHFYFVLLITCSEIHYPNWKLTWLKERAVLFQHVGLRGNHQVLYLTRSFSYEYNVLNQMRIVYTVEVLSHYSIETCMIVKSSYWLFKLCQ